MKDSDLLPFSGPSVKTRQALIDAIEAHHLQLKASDRNEAEILQSKDPRISAGLCSGKSLQY